jgi:uncharacterized LabA/DUF88 family protein
MERAAIFIDGANVFYQQRELDWQIDWVKLIHYFNEKYRVVSARYYTALKEPPSTDQKKFHTMLSTTGYALKTKILKKITDHETGEITTKGNLDIELVIDALTTVDQYDVFILFSGDSDFVPLITALRQQRKVVKAFSTKGFSSIDLVSELGMDFKDINEFKSRLEYKEVINKQPSKRKPIATTTEKEGVSNNTVETIFPDIGDEFIGSVISIKDYGVFLSNAFNAKALLHIKNMNAGYISKPLEDVFNIGDEFNVKIENVDTTQTINQVSVSLSDGEFQKELINRINQ